MSMCLISYLVTKKIFGRGYHRKGKKISSSTQELMGPDFLGYLNDREEHRKILEALPFKRVEIKSNDGLNLVAHYYAQPQGSRRTAILVHGHHSNGFEGYAATGLAYIRQGFNILLPDNRSCGESEGKWCTFGLKESKDVLAWLQYLVKKTPDKVFVLHGCSLGGATVCMCSNLELPNQVKAIVSDCTFSNISSQIAYTIQATSHLPGGLFMPGVSFWFKHLTGIALDSNSPLEAVKQAKVPMIFIHGGSDRYVLPDNSKQLDKECPTEKELVIIPGAGHASARYIGQEKYEGPLFAFLDKYTREESV